MDVKQFFKERIQMKNKKIYSLILASAATLTACNGGGTTSNTTPTSSLTESWNQSMQQQGDTCVNQAIKADSKGNTYVAGSCTDSYGIEISHLIKYDAKGKEIFNKTQTMNTDSPDSKYIYANVTGITIDKNNEVYVGSYAQVTDDVTPTNYDQPQIDGSIYKYDANGTELWHVTFGNNDYQTRVEGITTDNDGNPIIVGDMKKRDASISDTSPYFMTKLNKRNGNRIFYTAQAPFGSQSTATGVVVNSNNEIFIAGQTNKSFSESSPENKPEYLVAKYNEDKIEWIKQQGTQGNVGLISDDETNIDTDGENVYINGVVYGNLFSTSASAESPNYYIAKYTSDGDLTWGIQNGVANQDYYRSAISVDKTNGIIYASSEIVESDNITANVNAFSTKNGSLLWGQPINNSGNGVTRAYAIYVSDGLLYLAGKSDNTAFGINNSISNQGGYATVFTIVN